MGLSASHEYSVIKLHVISRYLPGRTTVVIVKKQATGAATVDARPATNLLEGQSCASVCRAPTSTGVHAAGFSIKSHSSWSSNNERDTTASWQIHRQTKRLSLSNSACEFLPVRARSSQRTVRRFGRQVQTSEVIREKKSPVVSELSRSSGAVFTPAPSGVCAYIAARRFSALLSDSRRTEIPRCCKHGGCAKRVSVSDGLCR